MSETILGMKEFQGNLVQLYDLGQAKNLRKATREGGEVIRKEASVLAPVLTGKLRDNEIVVSPNADANFDQVEVLIGPSTKAFWGIFEEKGTKDTKADPFLGPAVETKGAEAVQVGSNAFWGMVEQVKVA